MWNPQGIYTNFILKQPAILHGNEAIRGLFHFPGNRIAVIYGNGLREDARQLLISTLKSRSLCFIKKSWNGEPELNELAPAVKELEDFNPDIIIALGGGSVIDGAKLCRICFEFPYINWENNRLSQMNFKTHFIAIPTTAGSGAEASSAAVYYDKTEKTKKMCVCHALQPEVVILDSQYIKHAPEELIYSSVADALAHMIEGYVSNIKNPLAEEMAIGGISAIGQELRKDNREEIDFMRIQYAGYIGGIVQNHCLVGAAHAFAHQLTSYGYSHGKAVALLLGQTIRINQTDRQTKELYQKLFEKTGFSNTEGFLNFLDNIIRHIYIEKDIKKLGDILNHCLTDKKFIENVKSDSGGKGNPVPLTDGYINQFIGEFVV